MGRILSSAPSMSRPPPRSGHGKPSARWITFSSSPHHPLAQAKEPLANKQLSQHRAIVIRDSARYCHPLNSNLLDEQPQIGVDDFASKVELLCAGLGCGFLPRHIARPWLVKGSLVEKASPAGGKDITYGRRSGNDGLAQRWWREALLRGDLLSQLYQTAGPDVGGDGREGQHPSEGAGALLQRPPGHVQQRESSITTSQASRG